MFVRFCPSFLGANHQVCQALVSFPRSSQGAWPSDAASMTCCDFMQGFFKVQSEIFLWAAPQCFVRVVSYQQGLQVACRLGFPLRVVTTFFTRLRKEPP